MQRFVRAKANKLKCLRHIRRLLKGISLIARERKTMNDVEHVISIYSKGDSLLVLAFDPVAYTSVYLMLPEEMNVSDILDNLEIQSYGLVINDEHNGMKLVFYKT